MRRRASTSWYASEHILLHTLPVASFLGFALQDPVRISQQFVTGFQGLGTGAEANSHPFRSSIASSIRAFAGEVGWAPVRNRSENEELICASAYVSGSTQSGVSLAGLLTLVLTGSPSFPRRHTVAGRPGGDQGPARQGQTRGRSPRARGSGTAAFGALLGRRAWSPQSRRGR